MGKKKNDERPVVSISDNKLRQFVKDAVSKHGNLSPLEEAYVSEPKPFKQVTDMVSQRTKDGHQELYKGYVDALNRTVAELEAIETTGANAMHSEYRSARLDETYNLNAKWLHELYFANCFDPNSNVYMDSQAFIRLSRDFGNFERWQKDFIACALSAGEGWAVCGYNMHLRRYTNTFISHHSGDVMLGMFPIVVLDMWSHAYHKDYVIDRQSYIVAMMRELNWNVIEDRIGVAEKIAGVLK